MANNIYDAAALTAGSTTTVTVTDDGSGIDWLVLPPGPYDNDYSVFRLEWWVESGVSTQARVTFWIGSVSYSLQVNGLIENVRGAVSAEWVNGNEADNLIYGDSTRTGAGGNDTLGGHYGDDTIYGGSGNDEIGGSYDDDLLFGDAGDDILSGGAGRDTLQGGAGADSLYGGADGSDWVSYTASTAAVAVTLIAGDTSTGSGGHAAGDRINGVNNVQGSAYGDLLRDSALSNAYNANIFKGMAGNDRLYLGSNHDTGYGGAGHDQVYGEAGNDLLYGDAGNDSLRGGQGADQLYGGDNADRFIFASAAESTTTSAGRDVLRDFDRAEGDKIDLRLIDARSGTATNDAFAFIGSAGFSGVKGQLQWLDSGSHVLVRGDINGDRVADFAILVTNVASLQGTDFLL